MQTGGSTVFPLESNEQMPYIVKMEPIPLCIIKVTVSITDTSFGFGQGRKWGAVKKFWAGGAVRAKHPTGVYLRGSRLQGGSLDPFGTVTYGQLSFSIAKRK